MRSLPGFEAEILPSNDDDSSQLVSLGFDINFFGNSYDGLYINNNGNVTFEDALNDWTPSELEDLEIPILAPFWADVDTRAPGSGEVTYGADVVDGRPAFGVNWIDVGYFSENDTPLNSFQLILIDRTDLEPGAFDVEFNYDTIQWEAGEFDGGIDGIGGITARAGYSNGSKLQGTYYEFIGSGQSEAFLDDSSLGLVNNSLMSDVAGRYISQFRSGSSLDFLGLAGQSIPVGENAFYLGEGMDPRGERPDFYDNANSLDTANVEFLRNNGGLGIDLDGAGVVVGVWDSLNVRETHREFAGRVDLGTELNTAATGLSSHATHVTGTILATGIDAAAAGYAPAARGINFDSARDVDELAANSATIDLSNHSYGARAGWNLDLNDSNEDPLNAPGTVGADLWLGVYDLNNQEDPRFGKYTDDSRAFDELLRNNPELLTVVSAGNDRQNNYNDELGTGQYVTFFEGGFGTSTDRGWYLVPDAGATAAPPEDGGADGFDTIGGDQKTAKNTLTVGNYSDVLADPQPQLLPDGDAGGDDGSLGFEGSSSFGPTDDGRIKPDVVANGIRLYSSDLENDSDYGIKSGTSMAAPSVTGLSALLLQHYRDLHSSDPRSATLKALLIHTASDVGNPGPDYKAGWGLVNGAKAAEFLSNEVTPVDGQTHMLEEAVLASGATIQRTVDVKAGGPFRATIVWTDVAAAADAAGVDVGTPRLINDLDIRVIGPDGVSMPWVLDPTDPDRDATTGRNSRDNVEQVFIADPTPGTYTIQVSHTGALQGGPQAFSLLASTNFPRTVVTADDDAPHSASGDGLADEFRVVQNGDNVEVYVNGNLVFDEPEAAMEGLTIRGSSDNDTLTVDVRGGLIPLANNIRFEGQAGFDRLNVVDATGTLFTNEAIHVGALPGDGTHTLDGQIVEFFGLEPVVTNVVAVSFTIGAQPGLASLLQDDNQINYEVGQILGATAGRVTIDNFEPIEFENKTAVTINAGAGTDTISLNHSATPTGLNGMTINGGDPTAGDTVIVSGTPGNDSLRVAITSDDDAVVQRQIADPAPYTLATVEHLILDGRGGNDGIDYTTPAGIDLVTHTPSPQQSSGTLLSAANQNGEARMSLEYRNVAAATIAVRDASGDPTDVVRIDGTDNDDLIQVALDGRVTVRERGLNSLLHSTILPVGGKALVLRGFDGDDRFEVAAGHPFLRPFDGVGGLLVEDGGGNDELVVRGTGTLLDIDTANRTITEDTFGSIAFGRIETVDVLAGGGPLTVTLTNDDDRLTYRPSGAAAGTFQNENDNTTFHFSDVTGAFTVDALESAADQVIVEGTNSHDRLLVDSPNRTVTVTNAAGAVWKTVTLGDDVEQVTASGRLGNDTFLVVPSPTVGGIPNGNLQVHVDGGQPGASDALVIATAAGGTLPASDFAVNAVGQTPGEGRVRVFRNAVAMPDISYAEIEVVSPNVVVNGGVPQWLVLGPDASEPNEFRTTATFLGSGDSINVDNLAIFPNFGEHIGVPADVDYFQIVAQDTGTLDVTAYFEVYSAALLPQGGQLGLNVLDSGGNVIGGAGAFGNPDGTANARVRIPAVAGQTYFVTVFGAAANGVADPAVVNGYELKVTNEAPPVPYDLELNDILQVGTVAAAPAATTTSFTAAIAPANGVLPATTFDYVGKTVEFTSGPNVGRRASITSFNSGTGLFGVAPGLIAAPAAGDSFVIETTDTGRSQFDNVTRDNTPIITFRLDDDSLLRDLPGDSVAGNPADEVIVIPFNGSQATGLGAAAVGNAGFRVAVFLEGSPQQQGTAPQTPIGYARQLPGTPGVYVFDFGRDAVPGAAALVLSDGSHFISAKVEIIDPSIDAFANDTGFGARSASLEIVVDTAGPTLFFGDPAIVGDGLHPDSDSGDSGLLATFNDGITNDLTPTFWGHAEANAIVKAYVDVDGSGTLTAADVLIGQTVASPLDGTNQEPFGRWELTSTVNMNDTQRLAALPVDGLRTILITAEDSAGNQNPGGAVVQTLDIFIDTNGPQVTNVYITSSPAHNLFTLKPNDVIQGPTPAVDGLTIDLQDFPARTAAFLYAAVSNVPPLAPIVLRGDHSGIIPITHIAYTSDPLSAGSIATGSIRLTFAEPLPDDRYTLTLQDNIIDPAGNALDGESNAAEPVGTPFFPTGDAIPGGDFVARFTVDSRPEVATWSQGLVYADINGNFVWDPEGQDNDATNRDFVYNFGNITDAYFVGNFAGVGAATASGFDKVGSYGAFNGVYQFFLDTDDDGVQDFVSNMPAAYQVNGIPIAGEFNAAHPGDEIGLFDGQNWYLDVNGNNTIDVGERFATTLRGLPVVGDFNGDGADDLATYNNDTGVFRFDLNRDHTTINDTLTYGFSGFNERPVAGDFNLDGVDDIAMWVPGREGQLPKEAGEFHFLISDNVPAVPLVTTLPSNVFDPFSPAPLGNDRIAQFGDDFALPLLGNFDPPVSVDSGGPTVLGSLTNASNPYDTNADGFVTPLDVLHVLNAINRGTTSQVSQPLRALASFGGYYLDVSQDGQVTPLDALQIINALANLNRPAAEAASKEVVDLASWSATVDQAFADDEEEEDDWLDLFVLEQNLVN
ncbi:S8 family serine peptidase [Rosistilla carotiformis]|uniref:S8 family serine peptidase n=1 Tax=Rosistilla carotiformis TaxID=2528017 RepID=UPI0018D1FAE1|nr:S8 family serine peptidase [Rosistilla carotiformis]